MNWKDYEKEIHDQFRKLYPNAEITYNTTVEGRYSKISRQIDILIEDYVAGNRMRIIVDGKFFSEKVDVKDVEMFIGILADCEANKGLLITQQGYSQAAINRAHFDPIDIELDILNFKDLYKFQGFGGIVYRDKHGVVLPAPFGWILDGARRRAHMLGTLYQRGLTFEEAVNNKEWMYVNISAKADTIKDLDSLLKFQMEYTLRDHPDAHISFLPTIKRTDSIVKIRTISINSYPTIEYSGFVEFDDFIFFCVLFTPEELKKKNIKKLESVLQQIIPLDVNHPKP